MHKNEYTVINLQSIIEDFHSKQVLDKHSLLYSVYDH